MRMFDNKKYNDSKIHDFFIIVSTLMVQRFACHYMSHHVAEIITENLFDALRSILSDLITAFTNGTCQIEHM